MFTCGYRLYSNITHDPVTEILVRQKFWSGGPKFLENWSAGPLFSENLGPRVELWSERQYFSVSTFNDTRLCQSVCIVSRIPRKEFGKKNKLLELLVDANMGGAL